VYLIWDIETVVDDDVIYETNKELVGTDAKGDQVWEPRAACIQRVHDKVCKESPAEGCFMPMQYHRPVVVGMLAIGHDGSYIAHQALNASGKDGVKGLVEQFWGAMAAVVNPPVNAKKWVSFNGKNFDAPVMEIWGHRLGVPMPIWFGGGFDVKPWEDPRNKILSSPHLDLMTFLSQQKYTPGGGTSLSYWARTFGLPGKTGVTGADSLELWGQGRVAELEDYCMTDCLNTAGLLLGVLRAQGHAVAPRSEAFEKTMLRVCDSRHGSKIYEAFWKAYKPTLPF